jgi:hypothetical protein
LERELDCEPGTRRPDGQGGLRGIALSARQRVGFKREIRPPVRQMDETEASSE